MNNKLIKSLIVLSLVFFISSCNNNRVVESSKTSQEQEEDVVIENENYSWNFKEKNAYKNVFDFSVESSIEDTNFEVFVDNTLINPLDRFNGNVKVIYDIDESFPCHSDTLEHAYNEITFNKEVIGTLPSDDSKGIEVDYKKLFYGENVFSITIGQVYRYNVKYDTDLVHGGLNGAGDDFKIKNVCLQTPSGQKIKPTKLIVYKPKSATSKSYVTYEISQPDDYYYIGDGWGNNLSYDKHSNPRLDIPFRIDYYFNYELPLSAQSYSIDFNDFNEGKHIVTLKDNGNVVLQNNIYVDYSSPIISTNIKNNDSIDKNFDISCEISDEITSVTTKLVSIDGINIDEVDMSSLNYGKHNITIYAKDLADNESYYHLDFIIKENAFIIDYLIDDSSLNINSRYPASFKTYIYEANSLNYSLSNDLIKNENNPDINVNSYVIDVTDSDKDLYISYTADANNGEKIALEVYNSKNDNYERLHVSSSYEKVNFKFNPKEYVSNGQVKINIVPIYTQNNTNKIIWSSDTQYLPKVEFNDINYMYDNLMQYVSKQYRANNIAYFIHTGDIVDNNPSYGQGAIAEWENATKAFEILDNNKVPYGVCAGNHDVGSELVNINYDYYSTYFGVDRFNENDYYGGSFKNNECHYDLITIGKYDFIFLYIGFGIEAKQDTILWANKILKQYSHRNAVLATHGYLLANGQKDPDIQAQTIFDEIVKVNDNVKFVFCGHNDGTAKVKQEIEGRVVYELLNCYQFVETKKYSVSHKINGLNCNGEGFIKTVEFIDNKVIVDTFSPVINSDVSPFGNDDYEITVDLFPSNRKLQVSDFKVLQSSNNAIISSENQTCSYSFDKNKNYVIESNDDTSLYGLLII